MPSFLCCLSLSLFVLRLPCSCLVMSCRAGCVLVPNLHLQDKSFRLVAFPGLPFTVAQFGCSVCPFASLVCCLVMYGYCCPSTARCLTVWRSSALNTASCTGLPLGASFSPLTLDCPLIDLSWKVAQGVLYTADRLIGSGYWVDPDCFCGMAPECPSHLFFSCPLAHSVLAPVPQVRLLPFLPLACLP